MIIRSLCGVLALVLSLAPPIWAQSDATPVVLDLVVRDKKNVAVGDLRAEEVEVYEDGAKRPFEGFRRVTMPPAGGAGAPITGAPTEAARFAVLLFPRLQAAERDLARSAAEEFIKKQLVPGMSVAVLLLGPELVPVQDFTPDAALIREAVKQALDPAAKSGEPDVRALYSLVQWLKARPDRKTAVLFSSGISIPPGFEDAFQQIVGLANRYRISFYGVDPRGLELSRGMRIEQAAEGADRLQTQMSGDSKLGTEGLSVGPSSQGASTEALAKLAQGTGGFALERTNNPSKGMRQIAEDVSGYYELTYTPTAAKSDGDLRQVEIKVARDGAKVQARRQYLLGDVPAALVPAFEQRLAEALATDLPAHGVEVWDRALHYAWDGKELTHLLWVAVPLDKVSLAEVASAAKFEGDVSILARVKDPSGKIATTFSQRFPLVGPLDQLARARAQTMPFVRRFKLAPGEYTLETAVEDRGGNKLTARRTPFKVQAPQGIALSSLSLCDALPAGTGADPDDPLLVGNQRLVPNLGQPIKAGKPTMTLHSVVYPSAGSKDPANIAITLLFGDQAINNATAVLPAPDANGRIRYATALRMDVLPPGTYRFEVAVTQGSSRAEERLPFTIVP